MFSGTVVPVSCHIPASNPCIKASKILLQHTSINTVNKHAWKIRLSRIDYLQITLFLSYRSVVKRILIITTYSGTFLVQTLLGPK